MLVFLLACAQADDSAAPTSACGTPPDGVLVDLPADDAAHPDQPVEWWYWTGHLYAGDTPIYGFEYVVFLLDYGGSKHTMVHRALTDLRGDDFTYLADYGDAPTTLATEGFTFELFDTTVTGGDGHDQIDFTLGERAVRLTLESERDPVYHHGDGYTEYDVGGDTFYYSREHLAVTGAVGDEAVTGRAWFDHQWGNLSLVAAKGWDWYALNLEDGRDMMFFLVHDGDTVDVVGGDVTDAQCRTTEIAPDDVLITARGTWTSPATGNVYPMGWDLEIAGEPFGLTPAREDQELDGGYTAYWEGDAAIDGTAGRAYVELNGYSD